MRSQVVKEYDKDKVRIAYALIACIVHDITCIISYSAIFKLVATVLGTVHQTSLQMGDNRTRYWTAKWITF